MELNRLLLFLWSLCLLTFPFWSCTFDAHIPNIYIKKNTTTFLEETNKWISLFCIVPWSCYYLSHPGSCRDVIGTWGRVWKHDGGKGKIKTMFTLYRIAFVPARKPYRIGFQFTHKNGDFGAISVTEQSCPESHISDRCSYYTRPPDSFSFRYEKLSDIMWR